MRQQKAKTYTTEFKESSVKLAVDSGQSIAQIARDLGLKQSTLRGWINKYGHKENLKMSAGVSIEEENQHLRKENARLKQERDILKKAAAYFANAMS